MTGHVAPTLPVWARESLAEFRRAWRTPGLVLATIGAPALLFVAGAASRPAATLAAAGVIASLLPSLPAVATGIATDRVSGLLELKGVAPLPVSALAAARIAAATGLTALALALLYLLAALLGTRLPASGWASLAMVHLGAATPLALIGLGLGLRLGVTAAAVSSGAAALLFVALAGPWPLPDPLHAVSWATPSYHLHALAAGIVRATAMSWPAHAAALTLLTMAASAFAWTGWRRWRSA